MAFEKKDLKYWDKQIEIKANARIDKNMSRLGSHYTDKVTRPIGELQKALGEITKENSPASQWISEYAARELDKISKAFHAYGTEMMCD